MGDLAGERGVVRIIEPATDDEWCRAGILIGELQEWDRRQSKALGFDADEVIGVFYPDDMGEIRRTSGSPEARFLLAMDALDPVGCAAYRRLTPTACEAYDVYVRPTCRGRGTGSALLQRLVRDAVAAGYSAMCLETATFMHDAHKLYTSLGFHDRRAYRKIPDKFVDATIWMECRFDSRTL